jgi:rhodanese-related sulfurtransferase
MKIKSKELKEALDAGRVKLLDVRTPAEFGEIHIAGSELMPLDRLEASRLKDSEVDWVLVCGSGKRAAQAKEKLEATGCERLSVLEGGVTAWEQAGLPVNRGKPAVSLERQVRITAGLLILLGVSLGAWVHPCLYGIAAFVGAGLTFAGITDWCGMGMLLSRAPWNQRKVPKSCSV